MKGYGGWAVLEEVGKHEVEKLLWQQFVGLGLQKSLPKIEVTALVDPPVLTPIISSPSLSQSQITV